MIPRIIHFIWMQGIEAMPADYRRCVESWAPLNPGWEIKVWSEKTLPPLRYAWALEHESATLKCELARFELVHQFGGIYFDADHECVQPIEPVVGGLDAFVSCRGVYSIENSGFGAVKNAAWLGSVLEELDQHHDQYQSIAVVDVFWRRALKRYPEIKVFPWWVFQAKYRPDATSVRQGEPVALHHRFALWTKEDPRYANAYGG